MAKGGLLSRNFDRASQKDRLTMQEGDPAGGRKGQLTVRSEGKDTDMYLVCIFH